MSGHPKVPSSVVADVVLLVDHSYSVCWFHVLLLGHSYRQYLWIQREFYSTPVLCSFLVRFFVLPIQFFNNHYDEYHIVRCRLRESANDLLSGCDDGYGEVSTTVHSQLRY